MKVVISIFSIALVSQACMTPKDREIYAEVFGEDAAVEAQADAEKEETPLETIVKKKDSEDKKHAESKGLKAN
ncbi:hypothetical protein [Pseudobacteriovorax antillogorgiicola]|uniref:Uncharacterized protein n=1 Tax=Pseudobacteriovorax antillogorgiicola TaxID=1513793 RepID=A0A1Y6C9T5_9BACT|nr:hypothetical protein [Pseudobacteriovorax antillogorgiicola]TCS51726.1 hypothetical protein EDD56_110111 [Pseudobacteriovorax antillogorgiicola]SMF49476.1 hypothetical protein SAMN06296036_11580 [Pseudobacteriovorax antillogorgiicola]